MAALNSSSEIVVLMLGTNDAKANRWAMNTPSIFADDYQAMAKSFLGMPSKPKVFVMVPPPLYRDGTYGMNQTVINTLFPGGGPAGVRTIAAALKLPASQVIDIYSLMQQHCPVVGGTPGHAQNSTDVYCDWIGSGGKDACHPNDIGYGQLAAAVRRAIAGSY